MKISDFNMYSYFKLMISALLLSCLLTWIGTATLLVTRGSKLDGNREFVKPFAERMQFIAIDYFSYLKSRSVISIKGKSEEFSLG